MSRFQRLWQRIVDALTERRERHGLHLSIYIEAAPLDTADLWPKLEAALDLIAEHSPVWIRRMQRVGNSIHVRRIPGTRAKLVGDTFTLLDPYLLADFLPAQIAASIVHEATHALARQRGLVYDPSNPAREERACRRAESRFGRRLLSANVDGARAVLDRAEGALRMPDADVGVVIDHDELRAIDLVTRIKDMPGPLWLKRLVAKRNGVLDTSQGRAAFGR